MKMVFGRGVLLLLVWGFFSPIQAQVSKKAQKQYKKALGVLNKDWNKSLVYLEKALKASPEYPAAYVTRGKIFHGQGKDSLAYEEFNKALAIDSGFVEAWTGTAEVLASERAWPAVALAYTKALRWDSSNPELYFQRAQALNKRKKYLDAILDYSEAIALDSTKYKYFLKRAVANRKMEYSFAALEDLDEAVHLAPGVAEPLKERARLQADLNNDDAVKKDLKSLAQMRPNDATMDYFRGKMYFSIGESETANKAFDAAIEKDKDYMEAYLGRALGRVDVADRAGAISDLGEVLRLAPTNENIYLFRGKLHMEDKAEKLAIPDFDRAIELDSTMAEAYYMRGFAHSALQDKAAATLDFEKVVALRPDAIDGYYNLGILYAIQSRYTDALAAHRKVEALKPGYKDNRELYKRLLDRLRRKQ